MAAYEKDIPAVGRREKYAEHEKCSKSLKKNVAPE